MLKLVVGRMRPMVASLEKKGRRKHTDAIVAEKVGHLYTNWWKKLEDDSGGFESTCEGVRGSSEKECRLSLKTPMNLRSMYCGLVMVLHTTCSVQVCNIISGYLR
jgi:hypothetical protein